MSFLFDFNWLDIIILLVILFYIYEGFEVGFISAFSDFISFVISFIIGLKTYSLIGIFLSSNFGVPIGFANAGGFVVVAVVAEVVLGLFVKKMITRMYDRFVAQTEERIRKTYSPHAGAATAITLNKFLGIIPGTLSAWLILSFFFTVIIALPFSPVLKNAVLNSKFGSVMVSNTQSFEGVVQGLFGQGLSESLNFIAVKPEGNEFVTLNFKTKTVMVGDEAEGAMLEILNQEREKAGLKPLKGDTLLRNVGRRHATDMFERGYFSHYSPEGKSPFDRMALENIEYYSTAGENLALAPTVGVAMQGLMNSPGHRANILSETYTKVGIAAIDGGVYGIMFAQEFSD